jgi:predicted ATPase
MNSRIALVDSLLTNVSDLIIQNENEINNFAPYASTYNQDILDDFNAMYASVLSIFSDVKAQENSLTLSVQKLKEKRNELKERKNSLVEEFAAIERTLAEQLKEEKNISPESFRKLKQKASRATLMLKELEKADKKKVEVELNLERLLVELNSLWHEEFTLIQKELEHINESDSSLKVSIEFKADKEAFLEYMKSVFKGSKIRESSFKLLVDDYPDFISMYQEIDKVMGYVTQGPQFRILFESNLKAILTYQVPNKVSIMYRDKILQQHSLGQRASALILFVLSQRDNDVIIIDQPEDDLDNQTIYNDVIKLLVTLKSNIQFILATHNPNIPVLGDSEQVMACSLSKDMVSIETGGIDVPTVQNTIVDIMEGGDEAFRRRKEIYTIWKPSN